MRLTLPKFDLVQQILSLWCPGGIFFNHFCRCFHLEFFLKRAVPVVHLLVMKLKILHSRGSFGSAVEHFSY